MRSCGTQKLGGVKLVFQGCWRQKKIEIELAPVSLAEKAALTCFLGIFKVFRGDFQWVGRSAIGCEKEQPYTNCGAQVND